MSKSLQSIINEIKAINEEQSVIEGAIMDILKELGLTEEEIKQKMEDARYSLSEMAQLMDGITPITDETPQVAVGRHPMFEDQDMLVDMLLEVSQDIEAKQWQLIEALPGRSILLNDEIAEGVAVSMEMLVENGVLTKTIIIMPTEDVADFKAHMKQQADEERAEIIEHECTNCGACKQEEENEEVELMPRHEVEQHIEAFLQFAIPHHKAGNKTNVELMWTGLITCMPSDMRFMDEELFLELQEFVKTLDSRLTEMDITVSYDMYKFSYDKMMELHDETFTSKTKFTYNA